MTRMCALDEIGKKLGKALNECQGSPLPTRPWEQGYRPRVAMPWHDTSR